MTGCSGGHLPSQLCHPSYSRKNKQEAQSPGQSRHKVRPYLKISNVKRAVVDYLPSIQTERERDHFTHSSRIVDWNNIG
jgi:hypothetical protein